MLSEKQLEDAARCNEFTLSCGECSNRDAMSMVSCIEEAAKTALALADMVKRLEWAPSGGIKQCPCCGAYDWQEHKIGCEIVALLKGLEG